MPFCKRKIERLGHSITQTGITPISNKKDAIKNCYHLQISKNFQIFYGNSTSSRKTYSKSIANVLTTLTYRKYTEFVWTDENEDPETRIKCDASRKGKGCALEQRTPNGWHTVAFASRFLNSVEDRFSINDLELMGVF